MDNYSRYNNLKQEHHKRKILRWIDSSILMGDNKEPEICKHFGCGAKLTHQEKLFGNKCLKHSKL